MAGKSHLLVTGTRPEIIKMAPVYKALKERGNTPIVVHTGQHDEVAHELYRFFEMPPNFSIELNRKSTALAHLSSALMDGMENVLKTGHCESVLVQGDTTSALIGALCSYYHGIPVGHIEAGLRTHEREPFPEEKNRELIGRIAHWHFPPTEQAVKNLIAEGIPQNQIHSVGNTVIDAALSASEKISNARKCFRQSYPSSISSLLNDDQKKKIILITAHRRENWGQPIRNIASAIAQIVTEFQDVVAVWPLHPNPAVVQDVEYVLSQVPPSIQQRIILTKPLEYPALIELLVHCHFTITDSGGIQEEASAFSKPVLVARASTERQELIEAGGGRLVGTEVRKIVASAEELLTDPNSYDRMRLSECPFGDGQAADRIVNILLS